MDRRAAIAGLGAGVWGFARELGGSFPSHQPPAPSPLSPLGIQLYTVRREAQRDLDGTLAQLARIGYREVEFWNYYGRTPAQVAQLLARHGLTSPSVHVGLESLEGDAAAATLAAAREIGHRYLVVAWTPTQWRRTLDDWRRLAERFNRAGERCRASGLEFGYHNHDFEFTPLEGAVPFDLLCEATDPALVRLQVDLYWMLAGGHDPVPFLRRWPRRVPSVHIKDRTADGRMVDVGAGAIDWRTVLGEARRAGVQHWFVEHDEPADALASVRASYEYLSRLDI
ncbi:MAG: hypothetical protein A2085_04000 [Gemmatimonadetes bacterium GWC2_71_10]|nr:MAG: hypothetical protein A2085_04000 [Gemmatimonadetes bacterium GWC2_71_10]